MTASPLHGWPAVLASLPEVCDVCHGRRLMQVRVTAEPRVLYGGPTPCPHCSSGRARGSLPIPLVPWRTDTPRSDAA